MPTASSQPGAPSRPLRTPDRDRTIGDYVRARRRAAGLTQRHLAELVGVGVRLVSELERNKPTLRLDTVNRVLAAFGKRVGVVDGPVDDMPS
jgi:y4mF family transcriptional regulator